jgi:hypothetical protein
MDLLQDIMKPRQGPGVGNTPRAPVKPAPAKK